MSNIFVISDTWFNRLIEDDPNENVVDRNEQIIQAWNSTIKKNDIVYVLGGQFPDRDRGGQAVQEPVEGQPLRKGP